MHSFFIPFIISPQSISVHIPAINSWWDNIKSKISYFGMVHCYHVSGEREGWQLTEIVQSGDQTGMRNSRRVVYMVEKNCVVTIRRYNFVVTDTSGRCKVGPWGALLRSSSKEGKTRLSGSFLAVLHYFQEQRMIGLRGTYWGWPCSFGE